jgi:hypothetical protein
MIVTIGENYKVPENECCVKHHHDDIDEFRPEKVGVIVVGYINKIEEYGIFEQPAISHIILIERDKQKQAQADEWDQRGIAVSNGIVYPVYFGIAEFVELFGRFNDVGSRIGN